MKYYIRNTETGDAIPVDETAFALACVELHADMALSQWKVEYMTALPAEPESNYEGMGHSLWLTAR